MRVHAHDYEHGGFFLTVEYEGYSASSSFCVRLFSVFVTIPITSSRPVIRSSLLTPFLLNSWSRVRIYPVFARVAPKKWFNPPMICNARLPAEFFTEPVVCQRLSSTLNCLTSSMRTRRSFSYKFERMVFSIALN